jgi:hypothetical protein
VALTDWSQIFCLTVDTYISVVDSCCVLHNPFDHLKEMDTPFDFNNAGSDAVYKATTTFGVLYMSLLI